MPSARCLHLIDHLCPTSITCMLPSPKMRSSRNDERICVRVKDISFQLMQINGLSMCLDFNISLLLQRALPEVYNSVNIFANNEMQAKVSSRFLLLQDTYGINTEFRIYSRVFKAMSSHHPLDLITETIN